MGSERKHLALILSSETCSRVREEHLYLLSNIFLPRSSYAREFLHGHPVSEAQDWVSLGGEGSLISDRASISFSLQAAYAVATIFIGLPVWRDIRKRVQAARIDSVMKIQ